MDTTLLPSGQNLQFHFKKLLIGYKINTGDDSNKLSETYPVECTSGQFLMRTSKLATMELIWGEFMSALEQYKKKRKANIPPPVEDEASTIPYFEKQEASVTRESVAEGSFGYVPGYLPPEDDSIVNLNCYSGSVVNRRVARYYAREWLKRWRDDPVQHIGSHSLLWQLRQILKMPRDVLSGWDARIYHQSGRSFGKTGIRIIDTALHSDHSGIHFSDSSDEVLEETQGLLLWAIYFKQERCTAYWL